MEPLPASARPDRSDIDGTGSYLPVRWSETYATADIVEYDGVKRVQVSRAFLLPK
jgi:nicotinate phosphoribosyltransferase